ncbi:MAG: metal-dependent transcriptional regulator [Chloroflexota bacterium]|jgi:DtxR family Mn-dependent transcriptional regulator
MPKDLTESIENYLKTIYELASAGQPASTSSLAERLNITPASVTGMIQHLASVQPPLVEYNKHRGVTLTPAGERAALEVIRHHRLIETYLVEALGYSWDEVHEEACRLEHVISEDFEERIAAALGYPERDPHGDPIPTTELVMPFDPVIALPALEVGAAAVVRRIKAKNPALLRHLKKLGITPGARLRLQEFSEFDRNFTIHLFAQNASLVLGAAICEQIFVDRLED